MKNGIKTTEFWVTLVIVIVFGILPHIAGVNATEKIAGAIVAGLTAFGYGAGRVSIKTNGVKPGDLDFLQPILEAIPRLLSNDNKKPTLLKDYTGNRPIDGPYVEGKICGECFTNMSNGGPCKVPPEQNALTTCFKPNEAHNAGG